MLNQCQFIGNLGADPDCRRTQAGKPVVNLSLAVSEKWRDKTTGENKEQTEWIKIVIFSEGLCKIAEQYLRKGSKVFVSGKWRTRKWTNQEGKDQYSTELVMQGFDAKLTMLDGANGGNHSQPSQNSPQRQPEGSQPANGGGFRDDMQDDVPFAMEWR